MSQSVIRCDTPKKQMTYQSYLVTDTSGAIAAKKHIQIPGEKRKHDLSQFFSPVR